MKAFNQRADRLEVRGAVLNCYDSIAIRKAKEVLWAECGTKLEELKLEKIRRRDTSSRSQAEADLEDILDAMEKLDACGVFLKLYSAAKPMIYCNYRQLFQLALYLWRCQNSRIILKVCRKRLVRV